MATTALKNLINYFRGKDTPAEEIKEARAVKAGKVTPKQYVKGEKAEGTKTPAKKLEKTAKDIKSGKVSPSQYAGKGKKK